MKMRSSLRCFYRKVFFSKHLLILHIGLLLFFKLSEKRSFLVSFLFFSKNDRFVFGKKRWFLKTNHSILTFKKRKTIVFYNDSFFNNSFFKTIVLVLSKFGLLQYKSLDLGRLYRCGTIF